METYHIIAEWAREQGFTSLSDIYLHEQSEFLRMGYSMSVQDTDLIIYDARTGETVTTFYGDAPFESLVVASSGHIMVAGDSAGRVLFLRWVGNEALAMCKCISKTGIKLVE